VWTANAKFERRFSDIEQMFAAEETLAAQGRTLESASLEQMDALLGRARNDFVARKRRATRGFRHGLGNPTSCLAEFKYESYAARVAGY